MLHDRAEDLRHGREEYAPLLLPAPHTPTEDERAHHNLTHLPPARWCEFCVQGRALAVRSKTPSKYLCASIAHFIQRVHGFREVTLRTDGESAITKLADEVAALRGAKAVTHVESTPRYASSAKGGVENAIKLIQGLARTLQFALEARYRVVIGPAKPIWPFLIRHAAYLAARFLVKPTGVTPYRAVFGEDFGEQIVEFGETVMARQPVSPSGKIHGNRRYKKADTLWLKGLWLGRTEQTAEHIVAVVDESLPEGKQAGVITVRTIRRLEKEKQADTVLLERMQGAPWQAFGLARGVSKRRKARLGPDATMMTELLHPETRKADTSVPGSVGMADDRANYEEEVDGVG
eukprot:4501933-Amphidinium_carterae.1